MAAPIIPAFTVAELGDISKKNTPAWDEKKECWVGLPVTQQVFERLLRSKKPITVVELQGVVTEADARAKMLVCLIENNLLGSTRVPS